MTKSFVTIIVLIKEGYAPSVIKKHIEDILDSKKSFVELFIVYSDSSVNKFIKELNIDLPMTVVKDIENLPAFCNLGLGNEKYLIMDNAINKITAKTYTQAFIGRRSNIVFR